MKRGKVINRPGAASRARVVCKPCGLTHTGINNSCTSVLSDQARARAYARRLFHDSVIAAWREMVFADGIEDPVKVAVEEAVGAFGRKEDFEIWAWYANRIGVNNFLELYFEQLSVMRTSRLRNPAAAFHARLKRFYLAMAKRAADDAAPTTKGGAA